MTAETFDIVRKKSTTHSVARPHGAEAPAAAADFSAVTSVREALDVCSKLQRDDHVVTADSIGRAQHVDAQ